MLVFINYWIEKCTVKHWNSYYAVLSVLLCCFRWVCMSVYVCVLRSTVCCCLVLTSRCVSWNLGHSKWQFRRVLLSFLLSTGCSSILIRAATSRNSYREDCSCHFLFSVLQWRPVSSWSFWKNCYHHFLLQYSKCLLHSSYYLPQENLQ